MSWKCVGNELEEVRGDENQYNQLLGKLYGIKSCSCISPSLMVQLAHEALRFQLEENVDLGTREKRIMADWLFEYVNTIIDMLLVAKEAEEAGEEDGDPGTGYIIWIHRADRVAPIDSMDRSSRRISCKRLVTKVFFFNSGVSTRVFPPYIRHFRHISAISAIYPPFPPYIRHFRHLSASSSAFVRQIN